MANKTVAICLFIFVLSVGSILLSPSASSAEGRRMVSSRATQTPTPTPMIATRTPTPTPTFTSSQFSLAFDLDAVVPEDALAELFFGALGGGGGSICYDPPYLERPTILDPYFRERTLWVPVGRNSFAGWVQDSCVCGYETDKPVTLSLVDPFGKVIFTSTESVEAIRDEKTHVVRTYCYLAGWEISTFSFLPADPLGTYTIQVLGENTSLTHSFELVPLTEPTVYYSDRIQGYIVAGFEPFETVRILKYSPEGRFVGAGEFTLGRRGVGLLTGGNPDDYLFVVRMDRDAVGDSSFSFGVYQYPPDITVIGPIVERLIDPEVTEFTPAEDYYRLGDYDKAIEINPDYVAAYEERAQLYDEQGRPDLAIADYSKVIELDSFRAPSPLTNAERRRDILHRRASLYTQQGRYDDAIADYTTLIDLDPNLPAVYYYDLAHVYDLQGNADLAHRTYMEGIRLDYQQEGLGGAISDYTRAIELDPDFALAYFQRGEAYRLEFMEAIENDVPFGLVDEYIIQAIADYDQAISLAPDFLASYEKRGDLYADYLEDYAQAIADYSQATRLDPDYLPVYYKRARLYQEQGMFDQAIADYSKIIELDPEGSSLVYYDRASVYDLVGEEHLALTDLTKAIKLDSIVDRLCPSTSDYLLCRRGGHGTFHNYDRAIELDPDFSEAYYLRAKARSSNDPDLAIADYTKAISLAPDYLPAYEDRAALFRVLDEYDNAIADYSHLIKIDPARKATDRADWYRVEDYYLFKRAELYAEQGQYDEAIADLSRLARLEPDDAQIYVELGHLHRLQGSPNQALADYRKAIELAGLSWWWSGVYDDWFTPLNEEIEFYDWVIELAPDFALAYYRRGMARYSDDRTQTIADFEQALEWATDPSLRNHLQTGLRLLNQGFSLIW